MKAYGEMRDRLRRGLISPDDRLVDLQLADELGASRMPVREALLQLVSEGYLVSTARGYRVPTLSLQDVAELFEVRRLLEPRAASLAAADIGPAGIGKLGRAVAAARKAAASDDFAGLFNANVDFREAWLGAVRNTRLAATISRFADHVQTVRYGTLHDRATQRIVVRGLAVLLDAMTRHDAAAAEQRMRAFIEAAESSFAAQASHAAPTLP